ncbi:MAG: hypothetical protein KDK53_10735 [Maritimibacter sp.]|nr:hypothetical protein [Maritimibacter sp.]
MAAVATMAPVTVDHVGTGFRLEPAAAFAKSGKGKGGSRDDDDDDDRDDDDDDRDDRDDDDKDDDDRDDDDKDDDDRDDDDPGGRNDGGDNGANGDGRTDTRRDTGSGHDPRDVVRVTLTANGITIVYRDGSRDVLSNGTFRREDASGRVLDSRAATGADLVRLRALAGGRAVPAATTAPAPDPVPQGHPKWIRLRGNDVIVGYTDGWTEAVENGRYRLTDRYGHIAVNRPETAGDRARLRALAGQ